MKRSRKTLFALLLALVMTLGLAATAWATEVVPTDTNPFEKELSITKVVEKTGNVAPPAETFTFVLEDVVNEGETKRDLAYYGITLMDDLKISTAAGTGTFEKTFKFKLPASNFAEYHWNPSRDVGSDGIVRYRKVFLLTEQNDGKAGWEYSTKSYELVFTYDIEHGDMDLDVYWYGDVREPAKFINTYTGTTVEIPFTKTVKLGGNRAPGKTDFTLEIFNIGNSNADCKDVPYTAVVTTKGAGDYDGKLIISGPEEQVHDLICEGFYVREKVKDDLSGWKYSDAVWHVMPEDRHESGSPMQIYPTKLEKTPNGEFYVDGETPVDKMTFVNIYTRNTSYTTPDEKPIASPKTFDAGVALYGVSALLSLTGAALVIKRKNG
ncbi:MAG: hypothetical protein MSF41_09430 [Oscillibacter sp.]|nr:hypothetical protein [Oscillibacter sp.]